MEGKKQNNKNKLPNSQPIYQMPNNQQQYIPNYPQQQQQQNFPYQMQQQYIPQINNIGYGYHGFQGNSGLKLLKPRDKNKKIAAIIISFCNGSTYDSLFTEVQQQSLEGTQVLVYSCGALYLPKLLKAYRNQPQDQQSKILMEYIKEVDHDCVVFNWECSSGYGGRTFSEGAKELFEFLQIIISKGNMAMFSDFSLKALINQWKKHPYLGANPFKQISQTSQSFQIRFIPGILKECHSAQLQIVGEMAEGGKCNVDVMASTIVYTVDQEVKHDEYALQVLTVVTNIKIKQNHLRCKIGEFQGAAGHVLLKYKSGGTILTSMGHWIELMKIDTSEKKLFQIAEKQYGAQYSAQMKMEYANLNVNEQKDWVSKKAVNFVQNQAPCKNMATKKYQN